MFALTERGVEQGAVTLARSQAEEPVVRETGILHMTDSTLAAQRVQNQPIPAIELRDITKQFRTPAGGVYTALQNLSLTIQPGEFCALVGPTGSGKSTTLSLIAGLDRATHGEVIVMGQPVHGVNPHVGFVFQTDAIFPWKSVLGNVAAGPLYRGVSSREAHERARAWITRVGLAGFEDRYPHQLSGGMRKRVALAQTLINEPQILLMDEPFSALDVQTRVLMGNELLTLWSSTSASVVFVTHDLEEAIALADRVVVLTAGPATVKGSYSIDLPRPRNVTEIRFNSRFVELYHTIWEDLRNEVMISYERSKQLAR
jgi:NitT/TauT family transport system ATP-binding protein